MTSTKTEKYARQLETSGNDGAAQELREWAAREERVEANPPTEIPPCPEWCRMPAGHDYAR